MRRLTIRSALVAALLVAVGCNNSMLGGDNGDGGAVDDAGNPIPSGTLDVQPSGLQTINLTAGQMMPTVSYTATFNGQPVNASWSVDRGEVGSIPIGPDTAEVFTPRGTTGGLVTVRAGAYGQKVARQVMILLTAPDQNGANLAIPSEAAQVATTKAQLTAGGGIGGVGGEGLGPAVTDQNTLNALASPTSNGSAQSFTLLYPYDSTVWPRGILAPNLMWRWSTNDADAVAIELSTTSGSFKWKGTFGRPAILAQTGGTFSRHPIPQDVWQMAVNSAGAVTPDGQADSLTMKLTIAKGGVGYGPLSQTWTVAPGRLSGIIYYNSYGTLLAKQETDALGGDKKFGGAVLSIHVGDTAPKLTAGTTTSDLTGCRTCHSVAADGSRLVVQQGNDYNKSSAYTLTPTSATEKPMSISMQFPAIYPDGSIALAENGQVVSLPNGTALSSSGLPSGADIGTPAFSPDGKLVAANPRTLGSLTTPMQKLVAMTFDPLTRAFGSPTVIVDNSAQPAETRPGWPAVFPDSQSVIFHQQTAAGLDMNGQMQLATRKNARAYISWTGITNASSVTPLNQLNGKNAAGVSYLPKLQTAINMSCMADSQEVGNTDADHSNDVSLNYEPTVNPVASGGYAWVVFTSRRMYGNLATLPPFCSDPRGVDLVQNITPKKLWVAAVDISGKPGTDASHPGFYLPAQELLAGNAKGYWVNDACKADGLSCETGDQCCNGFCQANGTDGSLVCSSGSAGQCSAPQEKCATAADCCDTTNLCVNNFCTARTIG
jgi:hypothetical protein